MSAESSVAADRGEAPQRWELLSWPLLITASFAVIWIIHRAMVQSVTLDEANTFLRWVAPDAPAHWEPHSNNHVLNSILMRASVWIFGLSHLAVRAPALLGGLLYIVAAYRLCLVLVDGRLFRWALFVTFVYNPFIMDYLVAARGYGLALGLFTLAMYLFADTVIRGAAKLRENDALRVSAAISACVGLCLCANYSFAYAGAFLLLAAWAVLGWLQQRRQIVPMLRFAAACSLPAALILVVFAGSALTQFPRDQLFWGSRSYVETFNEFRQSAFLELNPYLVNPLLAGLLEVFEFHMYKALAVCGIAYLALLWVFRERLRSFAARSRLVLAGSLILVLGLTALAHWLQFKLFKIPLPFERTSIYAVPLATALFGSILSVPLSDRIVRVVRACCIAILLITGVYFIGELRDSYFREWRNCADVRAAFPVVRDLCRRTGAREIATDPNLTSSFKFYVALYHASDIGEVASYETMPPDRSVYVVLASRSGEFMQTKGLRVAWHGATSDLAVLVRQ